MAPAVEGLDVNPCGASDLSHALPVGRAHALPDLGKQLRVIRRFHRSSLGPLMDRSDRADNFAGSGGLNDWLPQSDRLRAAAHQHPYTHTRGALTSVH